MHTHHSSEKLSFTAKQAKRGDFKSCSVSGIAFVFGMEN